MAGPHPATAAIRRAVRGALDEVAAGELVLVACSGGADSSALAAATAFEAPKLGVRTGVVVVDHGLQAGSDSIARRVADWCRDLGFGLVHIAAVRVVQSGHGLESAARDARYEALDLAADRYGATMVLLGHTLDDQAEQVLLGLARGAGARSLSGMPHTRGRFHRPLLGVTKRQCRQLLADEGLQWWEDPMNEDTAYARVRARYGLADLERALGPGIAQALARTASQLRDDADFLDGLADEALAGMGPGPWTVEDLLALARPVRTRVWRRLVVAAGAPAGQVSTRHTDACDALLTRWHGQGPVSLPGPLVATRSEGRVSITRPSPVE